MKKIILIISLLIVFGVGCSNDKITELENRIAELEMDLICSKFVDSNGQSRMNQIEYRFLSRSTIRTENLYCQNRIRYFKNQNGLIYKYSENLPDDFKNGKNTYKNEVTNNMTFDPIYKEFYIEK